MPPLISPAVRKRDLLAKRFDRAFMCAVASGSKEEHRESVEHIIEASGPGPAVVIDLGGGSLDLALGRGAKIVYAASEPLGVTRLHAEYVRDDPMSKLQMKAIRDRVRTLLAPHVTKLAANKTLRCAGAGGTVRAIARLVRVERGESNIENVRGISILRSELESLSDQLRRATHAERIAMPGMRTQRAALLPTGAIVLATLLGLLDLPEIMVSDWGLRQGMLLTRPPVEHGSSN